MPVTHEEGDRYPLAVPNKFSGAYSVVVCIGDCESLGDGSIPSRHPKIMLLKYYMVVRRFRSP